MSSGQVTRRQLMAHILGAAGALYVFSLFPSIVLSAPSPVLTFFDPRFPRAHRLALQLSRGGALQPVSGDPTVAVSGAQFRPQVRCIQGVTLGSVPFCFSQLNPRAAMSLQRVDRDLFAWVLLPN
jgi:hypothetical protein